MAGTWHRSLIRTCIDLSGVGCLSPPRPALSLSSLLCVLSFMPLFLKTERSLRKSEAKGSWRRPRVGEGVKKDAPPQSTKPGMLAPEPLEPKSAPLYPQIPSCPIFYLSFVRGSSSAPCSLASYSRAIGPRGFHRRLRGARNGSRIF